MPDSRLTRHIHSVSPKMNTLSFLLLLLLTPGPEGSPRPVQADQCLADINIIDVEEVGNFINEEGKNNLLKYLYVRPGIDFQGVILAANISGGGGGGEEHVAWFTREDMCPMDDTHWWQVKVSAWLHKLLGNNGQDYEELGMGVSTDVCYIKCYKNVTTRYVLSLRVTAHGNSTWRLTKPEPPCPDKKLKYASRNLKLPSCNAPPHFNTSHQRSETSTNTPTPPATPTPTPTTPASSTSPTTPTTLTTSTVVSAAVAGIVLVLLLMVAVVVVVVRR